MSDEELAARRVATALTIRELCTPLELAAFELDRGFFLAWSANDDYWDECVVHGGGFGQRQSDLPGLHDERYSTFELQRALGLRPDQVVVRRSTHTGANVRREPVIEEIAYRRSRASVFNSAQPLRQLMLESADLAQVMKELSNSQMPEPYAGRWR